MILYKKIVFWMLLFGGIVMPATLVSAAAGAPAEAYSFNRPLTESEQARIASCERIALSICFQGYVLGMGTKEFSKVRGNAVEEHFKRVHSLDRKNSRGCHDDRYYNNFPNLFSDNMRLLAHVHNNLCARFLTLHETNEEQWGSYFGICQHSSYGRIKYFVTLLEQLVSLVYYCKEQSQEGGQRVTTPPLTVHHIGRMSSTGVCEGAASTNSGAIAALFEHKIDAVSPIRFHSSSRGGTGVACAAVSAASHGAASSASSSSIVSLPKTSSTQPSSVALAAVAEGSQSACAVAAGVKAAHEDAAQLLPQSAVVFADGSVGSKDKPIIGDSDGSLRQVPIVETRTIVVNGKPCEFHFLDPHHSTLTEHPLLTAHLKAQEAAASKSAASAAASAAVSVEPEDVHLLLAGFGWGAPGAASSSLDASAVVAELAGDTRGVCAVRTSIEDSASGITLRLKKARLGPHGQERYFVARTEPVMEDGDAVYTPRKSHPVFKAIERAQEMQRRAKAIFETRRREPNTGPGVDRASEPQALPAAAASVCAADAFAELYETVEGREYQGSYARGSKKASEMECYERRMEELRQEHQASALKRADQEERNVRHQARGSLRPTMLDEALSMTRVGSKRSRNAAGSVSSSPSAVVFVSDSAGSGSPETMNLMGADDLVSPSASSLSHGAAAALSPAVKRRRAGAASTVRQQGVEALLSHYRPSADEAAMPSAAGADAAAEGEVIVIGDEGTGSSPVSDQLLNHLELYERVIIDLCCENEMTSAVQAKLKALVSAHPRFMWFVYHRLVMRSFKVGNKLFQESLKSQHAVLTELHKLVAAHMKESSVVPYAAMSRYAGSGFSDHDYAVSTGHFLTQLFSVRMEHELIFGSRREEVAVPLIPAHDDALRTSSSSAIAGFPVPESFGLSTDSGEFFMQYARENHFKGGRRSRK